MAAPTGTVVAPADPGKTDRFAWTKKVRGTRDALAWARRPSDLLTRRSPGARSPRYAEMVLDGRDGAGHRALQRRAPTGHERGLIVDRSTAPSDDHSPTHTGANDEMKRASPICLARVNGHRRPHEIHTTPDDQAFCADRGRGGDSDGAWDGVGCRGEHRKDRN